jgi:hypothetical protein
LNQSLTPNFFPKPQPSNLKPQPAISVTSLLARGTSRFHFRLPFPPSRPQVYNGHLYASAHRHQVDGRDAKEDGHTPVSIFKEFEIAPGDDSDVEVANAHAWGSERLVFKHGRFAYTNLDPSKAKGKASLCKEYNLTKISP